jgi:crossover junction endodeoxyribonuclease RuvC
MSDNRIKVVIGVDPGLDGGLAAIELGAIGEVGDVTVIRMPTKPGPAGRRDVDGSAVSAFINHYAKDNDIIMAAVESVHAMPKQGITSVFNFGKGYGKLLGIIESFDIPLDEPTPQQWQALVLAGMKTKVRKKKAAGKGVAKSNTDRRDKDISIRYVLNHFPGVNLKATEKSTTLHDGMAEAICIAEYARRVIMQPLGGRLPTENAP